MQYCYSFYVICVNFATLLIAYLCFRKMTDSPYIGLAVAIVYSSNIYRIMNINTRAALGEYTAMTFFPLILYGLWAIYTPLIFQDGTSAQRSKRAWLWLVIGYTGVIQSHTISTMLVGIMTIVVCLIMAKQTIKKETFFALLKAFVFTILVNLWFLLPFLDYMRYEWVGSSYNEHKLKFFMENAVYLPQFFMVDYVVGGGSNELYYGIRGEMLFTLSLTSLLTIIFCLLFKGSSTKQDKNREAFCLMTIAILIFAASTLCPWDKLAAIIPAFAYIAATLQYPFRLNSLTILFAAWLLCILANKLKETRQRYIVCGIVIVGILQAFYFNSNSLNVLGAIFVSEITDSQLSVQGGEYLPADHHLYDYDYTNNLSFSENLSIHEASRRYNSFMVSLSNNSNTPDFIKIPLINYPGYRAVDVDTGMRLKVSEDLPLQVNVEIPASYDGIFEVRFVSPWYWRVAEAVSVLATVGLAGWYFHSRKSRENRRKICPKKPVDNPAHFL
jgi:hypothetical protein